jgi:hypothetical protein
MLPRGSKVSSRPRPLGRNFLGKGIKLRTPPQHILNNISIVSIRSGKQTDNGRDDCFAWSRGQCACLGALILADGEVSYMSAPANGKRYFRARVRIGIYEPEPIGRAAALMGIALTGPRKGRYEAEAQGSRAVGSHHQNTSVPLGKKIT